MSVLMNGCPHVKKQDQIQALVSDKCQQAVQVQNGLVAVVSGTSTNLRDLAVLVLELEVLHDTLPWQVFQSGTIACPGEGVVHVCRQ